MLETDKILLQQKKKQIQIIQHLKEWVPYWRPIFDRIAQMKKSWSFEYFECVSKEDYWLWAKLLQHVPETSSVPLSAIKTSNNYHVHNKMKEHYQSNLAMRYLPTLSHHEAYEKILP